MLTGLIAECGQHHLGDMEKAKLMVKMAQDAGASFAKFQAIKKERPASGSMPDGFYKMCALTPDQYLELQEYGDEIGMPVFFSFFDDATRDVVREDITKIASHQFRTWALSVLAEYNDPHAIVSIGDLTSGEIMSRKSVVDKMNILYVSKYNKEPNFDAMNRIRKIFDKRIGYSCHWHGTEAAAKAIRVYGARLVEKHFNPFGAQIYDGVLYRDCQHAADQKELELIARILESNMEPKE